MKSPPVALITGSGSRRIGSVIASELGRRGYSLILHYRTSGAEAEQQSKEFGMAGIPAVPMQADLRKGEEVAAMFDRIRTEFGRLDVLVNAASIWKKIPLELTTEEDVREHFETNTLGTFLTCQSGGLMMVDQPTGGCIVNIGDWAEVRPYPGYSAYFASKGGVSGLTRSMSVELANRNPRVRVNCILPGPVMLPEWMSSDERRRIVDQTLVKREGRPEHIACAVNFLIDNDYVTGICLPVDGGRTIHADHDRSDGLPVK